MSDSLYSRSDIKRISELNNSAPEILESFSKFNRIALAEGESSNKTKRLIAIAVAHKTGCPYCIDIHVKVAKKMGVTKEEIAESTMVAVALKAGSTAAHSVNALNAFDNVKEDNLYKSEHFNRFSENKELYPSGFDNFVKFDIEVMKPGVLGEKTKRLIAIASAHTTGCPYCIEVHVKAGKKVNIAKEEMAESIMVAAALKAGSAVAHGINALNAFD